MLHLVSGNNAAQLNLYEAGAQQPLTSWFNVQCVGNASGVSFQASIQPAAVKRRDSITEYVASGLVQISDSDIRGKIANALNKLGELQLYRNNRSDFKSHRVDLPSKKIDELRAKYSNVMQSDEAEANALVKHLTIHNEAFCGEHTFAIFKFLKQEGVNPEQMAVIKAVVIEEAVGNGMLPLSDHALLLYSNKPIDRQKAISEHIDQQFIIIDPWIATNKVVALPANLSVQQLDNALKAHFFEALSQAGWKNGLPGLQKIKYDYRWKPPLDLKALNLPLPDVISSLCYPKINEALMGESSFQLNEGIFVRPDKKNNCIFLIDNFSAENNIKLILSADRKNVKSIETVTGALPEPGVVAELVYANVINFSLLMKLNQQG